MTGRMLPLMRVVDALVCACCVTAFALGCGAPEDRSTIVMAPDGAGQPPGVMFPGDGAPNMGDSDELPLADDVSVVDDPSSDLTPVDDVTDDSPEPLAVGADPGTEPWVLVPEDQLADVCGLDATLLAAADADIGRSYAVVRHGKLCHEYYPTGQPQLAESTHIFSASKTLAATVFGAVVYETRDLVASGPGTGPLSDLDRMDYWISADSITFNKDARVAHVLAMTGYNQDLSYGAKMFTYDADGGREIQRLADVAEVAMAQDSGRLGTSLQQFTIDFIFTPLGMQGSTWAGFAGPPPMAYGWNATLRDMLRLGVLLMHEGSYNGERLLDADWVYKMTHAAFEDANTGYGYLTWLGTSCAPAPRWKTYPHGISEAPDCGSPWGCNDQQYDVGVWQASGRGGQHIQGHKGLDLVLVVKDFDPRSVGEVWDAVRPALVALDPMYAGDESGFCSAYSAGSYAPDL